MPKPVVLPPLPPGTTMEDIARSLFRRPVRSADRAGSDGGDRDQPGSEESKVLSLPLSPPVERP